jgi:hypothetical protein
MSHVHPMIASLLALGALAATGCDDPKEDHHCTTDLMVGSGYPSACDPLYGCPDGGVCGAISPTHDMGVCSIPCVTDADCAVDIDCTAVGRCILEDTAADTKVCAYTCEAEADCPPAMACTGYLGLSLCYPKDW